MDVRALASDAATALSVLEKLSEIAYHQYKESKFRKRMSEINDVNNLHTKHLTNIPLNTYSATAVTLPKIFIFDDPSDPKTVQIPKLTEACLDCNTSNNTVYNDPYLSKYGYLLANAIRGLKLFYKSRLQRSWFRRGSEDDPTSGTLCYLIEVLNKHCRKFRGYETDIAYVGALAQFINGFASLHKENSERFAFLTSVYADLINAQEILREHSLSILLKTQISELVSMCLSTTEQMIKLLTKFITPNKNWRYIDETKLDWLALGIITPSREFKGAMGQNAKVDEIPILECIIKEWIKECAKDYLNTIQVEEIENTFCVLDHAYKNSDYDKDELERSQKIFTECKNFLTVYSLDKNPFAINKDIAQLTSTDEIKYRLQLLADFTMLIGKLIALQYFGSYLWLRIKQFGEIYMEHPHHLIYTLNTLQGLSEQLSTSAKALTDRFSAIAKGNKNIMLLIHQQRLYTDLMRLLDEVETRIGKTSKVVGIKGIKLPISQTPILINSQKDKMVKLAKQIATAYNIEIKNYKVQDGNDSPENELSVPDTNLNNESLDHRTCDVDDLLYSLHEKIIWMSRHEVINVAAYQTLFQTLMVMKWKCEELITDKRMKAGPILNMLCHVTKETLKFILLPEPSKQSSFDTYLKAIENEMKHTAIDQHKNKFYGLFVKTDSRKKSLKVLTAVKKLYI